LDSVNAVFAIPDYITEGGGDGGYLFSYLPNGHYRAIAVEDKNKNHLLDHGEKAGVGAFDVELSGPIHRSPPLYLYLREMDTTRFELVRCRVNTDRVLLAEFSHPVDSLSAGTASWTIEPVGTAVKPEIECPELDAKSAKTVRLSLRGVNTGVSYRLSVRQLVDQLGSEIDSTFNRAEFFWPTAPDTVAPSVISSSPGHREDGVDPHRPLEIRFSEAVDIAQIDRSFYVADSTGAHVAGSITWSCPWQMTFIPESVLVERTTYMMVLDSGSVRDPAGNAMLKRWAASFATVNPDNLGGVAGTIHVLRDDWLDKAIVLEFVPVEKKLPLVAQRLYGQKAFEYEMPAGRYVLRAFVDTNENRRFDYGAVVPFLFAEPRFFFPDTVDVRARFVTEGLELTIP